MPTPTLSVVVPVLNEAHALAHHGHAFAALRARGSEVIVVDGGSVDRTRVLAARFASQVIDSEAGRAGQMNAGARAGTGHLLWFLHADSPPPDAATQRIIDALEGPQCWGRFDVTIEGRHPLLPVIAWAMNHRSRWSGIATGDQGMFMTRDAFEAVGGFPEQPLMEDIEMSRRLKRLSPPACLSARLVTSGRRWEHEGVGSTVLLMWKLRYRYWRGVGAAELAREYRHVR